MAFKWHFAITRLDTFNCGGTPLLRNAREQSKLAVPTVLSSCRAYLALVNYKSNSVQAHALCSNKAETRTVCIRSGKRWRHFLPSTALAQWGNRVGTVIWGETSQPGMLLPSFRAEAAGEGLRLCRGDTKKKPQQANLNRKGGTKDGWGRLGFYLQH